MKKKSKRILAVLASIFVIVAAGCLIAYYGFYARVYNQTNVAQNTKIGSNVQELTQEQIVANLAAFPDRFAGTAANAVAGQYIRNYFTACLLYTSVTHYGIALVALYPEYCHSFISSFLSGFVTQ